MCKTNPKAKRSVKSIRGVSFGTIKENGIDYYQIHGFSGLGAGWFTKKEIENALDRGTKLRKKYGWSP